MSTVRTWVDRCGPTVEPQDCILASARGTHRSAHRVVSDLKLLDRDIALLGDVSEQECSLSIGSVPLIRIRLDDNTAVDPGSVIRLVSLGIIRVDLAVSSCL